ncbi:TonB-dependent receptor plug domain-containing protein [Aliiglaciecola litoralis]|uniref:TonB-dependent receptor n=1 Tax=Aliiglaciecola litoralis TaxID=582857 RepID=A0ABP3X2P1_9ALTE
MNNLSILLAASFSLTFACAATQSNQQPETTPASQEIEKVSVVSSRISLPTNRLATSVTVLDEFDLQMQSTLSIADILRTTTSVGVSNSGGLGKNTVLRIRGEEGFRTKLYIDGVELSDTSSPQVAPIFDDVLVNQLSRVEILRGTQGLAYGADAGGVIALYTESQQQGLHGNIAVSASRYNTLGFTSNLSSGNDLGSLFLSASTLSSDGFNAQSSDLTEEKDGYHNKTVHFKGHVNLTDTLEAGFVVRQVNADNHYDGCFDNITFAPSNHCSSNAQQNTYRASLNYDSDAVRHHFAVDKTAVERRYFNNAQFSFNNSGSIRKLEYMGSVQWYNHDFVFGLDAREERLDSESIKRKQQGIFAEWLGDLNNGIYINLGLRHDDNDTFGTHDSVRVGLVKQLQFNTVDIKLKSTFGTGFRAPSLFEQNYNDGPFAFGDAAGLQLSEENSNGLDIGFELLTQFGSQFEMVWFEQEIENEIVFDLSGFQGYFQSVGSSSSEGVELSLHHAFDNGISVRANYTYNDTRDNNNERRLRRPKNKFNLSLRKSLINDLVTIELHHRIVNDAVDINSMELDDYSVTDISAQIRLSQGIMLNTGLTNLFDHNYQEVEGFNTAQRSLHVSLSVSL